VRQGEITKVDAKRQSRKGDPKRGCIGTQAPIGVRRLAVCPKKGAVNRIRIGGIVATHPERKHGGARVVRGVSEACRRGEKPA